MKDPIRDGLNWYTYCDGNLVMVVDNLQWKANLAGGKDKVAQDLIDGLYGYTPADAAQYMKLPQGFYVVNYGGVRTWYYTPH